MKAIVGGTILLPGGEVRGKALLFDERIAGLCDADALSGVEKIDAAGLTVSPGLVDMHIHGYLGEDASDGKSEGIRAMARGVAKNGVTAFLPTTMTVSKAELRAAFEAIEQVRIESRADDFDGAEILGVNAEGPFINPAKKGAQAEENILPPDAAFLKEYAGLIRLATIAPEMPGALEAIRDLSENSAIRVSMGHTNASFDQAMAGVEAGAKQVTHLFNAMTPLLHRDPGVVGAALTSNVTAELIADTFHVSAKLFPLLAKVKGDRLILITDCTRAGGLADGQYDLGGQPIFVKGIECRLSDGTIAGSVLKLNQAVKNFRAHTDLPLHEVVKMASLYPAMALGEDGRKGSLLPGRDADIVLADENFDIVATYRHGRKLYGA